MKKFDLCLIELLITTCSYGQFNNFYLTEQRGYGMAIEVDDQSGNYIVPYLINPTSEHDSKIHLSLFPNPASDFVQITAADVDLSTSTLRCLDMLGRSCPIALVSKSQHDMVIDTRSLPNGNYILELEALQLKVSTPLIISR